MNLFQNILLNSICLVFPLMIYLLYQVYSKTLDKEKNELYLDVALVSSFYLIIQFKTIEIDYMSLLFINIPLLLAYIKKRNLSIILLSVAMIIHYIDILNIPIIYIILEYIIYYFIYLFLNYKKYNTIIVFYISMLVKCTLFLLEYNTINTYGNHGVLLYILVVLVLYAEVILIIKLFKKTEDILKLYKTIQELQEEKQVRESLFKITHEIKNPIAVCKGYLDMFDVNNLDHSKKYVPIIKSEIERVLILLKDFLSITKIKLDPEIIDINLLLEDVMDSFIPLINDRKIKLISHIEDEELYITADYNRLSQVVVNLIKNSIEALEEIKDGQIDIYVEEKKNEVIIKIVDNGIGISKEDLERMNQPFFTTKTNGTGLGVYLSTEIIKAHGGDIVYSSKGKGTTVKVILPIKKGY